MLQVLTDAQWTKFEAAIAAVKLRGARPRKNDRRTIEAIIWRLSNGAKWRSIPAELGDWHHAYLRFRRWSLSGVWDKIMAHAGISRHGESVIQSHDERRQRGARVFKSWLR